VKPTGDRVLLAAGLACVGAGAVLLFAPEAVPGLGPLEPLTDVDTATQVGLLLGLVVAVVAAFQMRRTARDSLDRSGLRPTPPEQPRDATVPRPSSTLANTYQRVSDRIGRSGRSGWHVVAYGRRARYAEDAATGRPDPPVARPGPPGMAPEPGVDPTRRPPAQQDGGRPLRDRPDRASDRGTRDGTPPTGERNRGTTARRPSSSAPDDRQPVPSETGRRAAESEEGGRRGDRERRPVSNGTDRRSAGEAGQTGGQRAESRQATADRQPTTEGEQQPGTGPRDRVDSDRREREGRGRSAWERRPTAGQFRRQSREQLLELLDDVAETAEETYATATGCDPATAERAVATGEWTDDRVAAAFLATDRDAPEFTLTERAAAWLGPQRTLERRLARTLDAIESHADSYLTYEREAVAGGGENE